MKTTMYLIAAMMIGLMAYSNAAVSQNERADEVLTIKSTEEFVDLANQWKTLVRENGMNTALAVSSVQSPVSHLESGNDFYLLSENELKNLDNHNYWSMVVGRNIVVPVISSYNINRDLLLRVGVTEKAMIKAIEGGGQLQLSGDQKVMCEIVVGDNANISELTEKPSASAFVSPDKLISANQLENKIALIRFQSILDDKGQIREGFTLVPVDYNASGRIENIENFYTDAKTFSRSVWLGKYPQSLYQSVFIASLEKPESEQSKHLVQLVLGEGQDGLAMAGITALSLSEVPSKLSSLNQFVKPEEAARPEDSRAGTYIAIVTVLGLLLIGLEYFTRKNKKRKEILLDEVKSSQQVFDLNKVKTPGGVLFDKSHTWTFLEKDGLVRIGIDDFLQHVVGKISRVMLADEGSKIEKGDPLMTIVQNGKKLTLQAPVSGYVKQLNPLLIENASVINESPFDDGWIYVIEPNNWSREREFLTVPEKYKEWMKNEVARFKDFIARAISKKEKQAFSVVMQDGGELSDHILYQMEPEVWEEFQNEFLNN